MPKKTPTSAKAKKTRAKTALPDLRSKGVSKSSSHKVRGGGINRIVVTDGKINA
jgi:hypothetical protein